MKCNFFPKQVDEILPPSCYIQVHPPPRAMGQKHLIVRCNHNSHLDMQFNRHFHRNCSRFTIQTEGNHFVIARLLRNCPVNVKISCSFLQLECKATIARCDLSPRFFCIDATLLCEFESDKI